MRTSDLPGVLAGFVISFAGLWLFAQTGDPCTSSFSERSSYVGGITVAPVPEPEATTQVGDATQIENPYDGLGICDYWPSPGEQWLTVIGLVSIGLVGGAAASRIGVAIAPWRGALAVAAAFFVGISYDVFSGAESPPFLEWLVTLIALTFLSGAVGMIGGALAKRFA